MIPVLAHAVWRRRFGLVGWSLGLVLAVGAVAASYPAVRGNTELDRTFARLSPEVQAALGLSPGSALTSPTGYLDSQFFANLLPLLLLVFTIGAAAWAVAGDETSGTLELLLANPVSRAQVAVARYGALMAMVALLSAVTLVSLMVGRSPAGLAAVTTPQLTAAVLGAAAVALDYGSVAFALGAAGTTAPIAVAGASVAAVAGFVVEGLAEGVPALRPVRAAMPWHWMLAGDPLQHGFGRLAIAAPLALAVLLAAAGVTAFVHRDLR